MESAVLRCVHEAGKTYMLSEKDFIEILVIYDWYTCVLVLLRMTKKYIHICFYNAL